jgi:hypothetical protein
MSDSEGSGIPSFLEDKRLHLRYSEEQRRQRYDPDKWRELAHDVRGLAPSLLPILQDYPCGLNRSDVTKIAVEAAEHDDLLHYKKLFLASMIWGFAQAGYGPYRTKRVTCSNDDLWRKLERVSHFLRSRQIAEAYDRLDVKFYGPAFFTKYMYFFGRAVDSSNYPIILDTMVCRSLDSHNALDKFATVARRKADNQITYVYRDSAKYGQYTRKMREWARGLNCNADDIECFLYDLSKSQSKPVSINLPK